MLPPSVNCDNPRGYAVEGVAALTQDEDRSAAAHGFESREPELRLRILLPGKWIFLVPSVQGKDIEPLSGNEGIVQAVIDVTTRHHPVAAADGWKIGTPMTLSACSTPILVSCTELAEPVDRIPMSAAPTPLPTC